MTVLISLGGGGNPPTCFKQTGQSEVYDELVVLSWGRGGGVDISLPVKWVLR